MGCRYVFFTKGSFFAGDPDCCDDKKGGGLSECISGFLPRLVFSDTKFVFFSTGFRSFCR